MSLAEIVCVCVCVCVCVRVCVFVCTHVFVSVQSVCACVRASVPFHASVCACVRVVATREHANALRALKTTQSRGPKRKVPQVLRVSSR